MPSSIAPAAARVPNGWRARPSCSMPPRICPFRPDPAKVPVTGHTRRGRPALPKDLPRTRVAYDLSDAQKAAFDALERIGEERSETLHYEPSKLTVIEHMRFKYAAQKDGESTIRDGERPAVATAEE
ncbi:unnamed protein product [Candidatus Paraburkholderia kirkii UZHbot1]|uniref:WGS project CAFE00000000 data, contig bkir_c423 n=1 Tax=Candidatus Paraburkholderia kirkii UZHbot1 TaxID=1055526 RepID=U3UAW7_9BURK|nr:unnamed protein product [Candidatus Paraburkholderia kirkii UZHbot1]